MKRNLEFAVAMFTLARFLCNFPHAEWRNWIGILCVSVCVQVVSCLMIIAYVAWRRKVGLRFSHEACVQQGVGAKLWERKNVLRVNMVKVRLQLKVGLLCETNKSFSFPRPTFTTYWTLPPPGINNTSSIWNQAQGEVSWLSMSQRPLKSFRSWPCSL